MENYFEANTGMKLVDAKLAEFNRNHKWLDYRLSQKISEHLYRIQALNNGGDCFIAGFPGAVPNDRLWTLGRNVKDNVFRKAYVSSAVLIERARVKHARKRSIGPK